MNLNVMWYQYLPLALYLSNVLAFSWGAVFFFQQRGRVSPRYRGVQLASVTAWVVQAWFLVPGADVSLEAIGAVAIGFIGTLGLFVWALRATEQARLSLIYSDDLPSFIVRSGPYQFFRHPFYSSYLICYFFAAAFSANAFSVLSFVVMAVLYFHAARTEESKFVRSRLAQDYEAYKKEVSAFLPYIY